jgi:H+/Cl- antiporter ClcA
MLELDYTRPQNDIQKAARRAAWIRVLCWIIFVAAIPVTLFCFHAVLYWGWVSGTPLSSTKLAHVETYYYVSLTLAVLSIVAGAIALVVALWHAPVREV